MRSTSKIRAYIALVVIFIILIVLFGSTVGLIDQFTRDGALGMCLMGSLACLIFLEIVDGEIEDEKREQKDDK